MYQLAASEHAAGIAEYERLVTVANFIRDNFPPMHAEGPCFVNQAALDAFANVSIDDLRAARELLAPDFFALDPSPPTVTDEDIAMDPEVEATLQAYVDEANKVHETNGTSRPEFQEGSSRHPDV
ncbi:hypothetical protein HYPSUDRAFT_200230 [Hypholoma sublateritium FD-334 SS-4]|uniref:Uncharacterized protein n=1 Tax=Hypholoma sublateritium (strain FD-334 SS-4) TaxID=945553 RepID=A0A0D2P212_HYPSF|nr:hypothetical protein HYPSUDRAFT_200230 [Hypholoma sublateritium FD-334 SS-4]